MQWNGIQDDWVQQGYFSKERREKKDQESESPATRIQGTFLFLLRERTETISEVHREAQKYGEIRKYNYVPRLYRPRVFKSAIEESLGLRISGLAWDPPNIHKAVLGNEDLRRARLLWRLLLSLGIEPGVEEL